MDRIKNFFDGRQLHASIIDILVVSLFFAYITNTFIVSNYQCDTAFLLNCLMLCLYITLRFIGLGVKQVDSTLIVWSCLICGLIESYVVVKQFLGFEIPYHNKYLITGSFFNPGPLGGYIATLAAVVTAGYKKSLNKWLVWLLIPMLVVLFMTWSRGAILGYMLSVAIIYRHELRRYWKWVIVAVVVSLIGLYFLKRGSADGRLFMFIVSFQTFIDNLWIGIGTGGYLHSLGEGIIRYFEENPESVFKATVGVADHSFCEPLRIAVEQGVIGVSLFMSVIMYAIWKMVKIDSPITYGIITLFFFSCFSYAFSIVPMCILFTVFLALSGSGTARVQWRVRNVGKIVIILPTIGVLLFASHQLQRRFDASRDLDRFSMYMDEVFISDYYELLPEIDDKVNYLYKFAELLRHSGRHNDSNHILRLATNISADPMLHIIMGRNYEDMKCYDLADEKYNKAYMMQPNRIYPLYRQMKMYEANNDPRLLEKAQQVYSFIPKVESTATRDIKNEACQILRIH